MICPLCRREQVVEVGVTMGPARVTMRSCSGCDARWWDDAEGNRIPFGQVLNFAGQTRRRRRRVTVADVLASPALAEAPEAPAADARPAGTEPAAQEAEVGGVAGDRAPTG